MTEAAYDRAIAEFWDWWTADLAGRTMDEGDQNALEAVIAPRVAAIDTGLQWEITPAQTSRQLLVVTAAGDPALRALARAWLVAAPPRDATWSFADLRQPLDDADAKVLDFGGRRVELGAFVVAAHRGSTAIDVAVQHPAFMDIGEHEAAQLTYLALDAYLGEEVVESWIGAVTWPGEPPLDAFPLRHLRSVVADFAAGWRGEDNLPKWVVLQGSGPTGSPVLAMAQVPLRQITFPLFDTHIAVTIPYADSTPEGLPGPGSLDALRVFEDRIGAALGEDGRVVAHQSHEGVRLLHAHADARSEAGDRVAAVAADWDQGDAQTIVTHDPGWSLVNHLAG